MSRKVTSRPARERSDIGTGTLPAASPGMGLAKTAELSGIATAIGAAAFGVFQAKADQVSMIAQKPSDVKTPQLDDDGRSHDDTMAQLDASPQAIQADRSQASHIQSVDTFAVAHPSAGQKTIAASEPAHVSQSHDVSDAAPIATAIPSAHHTIEQPLIEHVAHQMTASISNVLDVAAKGNMTPIHVQELAQTIVQTATTIVDEVKAQLAPVADISSIATVVQQATEPTQHLASDISHHVADVLDSAGVIDLLDGATAPVISAAQPVNEIVAGLSGLSGEITNTVAATAGEATKAVGDITHAADQVAEIPASILGGHDAKGGMLADLFYDDGGAQDTQGHGLSAIVPALELPDIGFAGQPLDLGSELTGLLHGGNALHLV